MANTRPLKKRLLLGLLGLACLTPLGVVLPRLFGAEGAWGEWTAEYLHRSLGFVPEGLQRLMGIWKAPVAEYGLAGSGGMVSDALRYVVSGIIGLVIVAGFSFIIIRILKKDGG